MLRAVSGRRPLRRRLSVVAGFARRCGRLALVALALPILVVLALRWLDPPTSAFILARQWQHLRTGQPAAVGSSWVDLERISPHLAVAVIAAEDQHFATHPGFDLEAIEKAMDHNARGKRVRGASTISQQTAKNLFLWQGRSWLRKGLEAWYTVLIEAMWPKTRILEVYVNVAEFGDGIYGAQAAARSYWDKDASALTAEQSARLAAVLPAPRRYSAVRPGPYVQRRAAWIQRQMRQLGGREHLDELD